MACWIDACAGAISDLKGRSTTTQTIERVGLVAGFFFDAKEIGLAAAHVGEITKMMQRLKKAHDMLLQDIQPRLIAEFITKAKIMMLEVLSKKADALQARAELDALINASGYQRPS